jgi:hypothetical protein
MSISNRHTVVPFVAGKTSPMQDQRLAKVGYKTTEKQKAKFPSIAVSVPVLALTAEDYNSAAPYIASLFYAAQDGIIRSMYESSGGQLKEVSDDDISATACIAYMEAEAAGDRLKKESIELWFDVTMAEIITVAVAEKLKFDVTSELSADQRKTIAPHVAAIREVFSTLAGGKTLLSAGKIRGCRMYLEFCDDGDETALRLTARLDAMEKRLADQAKKDAELLENLGFAEID